MTKDIDELVQKVLPRKTRLDFDSKDAWDVYVQVTEKVMEALTSGLLCDGKELEDAKNTNDKLMLAVSQPELILVEEIASLKKQLSGMCEPLTVEDILNLICKYNSSEEKDIKIWEYELSKSIHEAMMKRKGE